MENNMNNQHYFQYLHKIIVRIIYTKSLYSRLRL